MKNPKWTRDELIVTLDFYHRHYPKIPEKTSDDVIELSNALAGLKHKLGLEGTESFRNPNGVYMKMMNFHHFNPEYSGKGLESGSRLDKEVWDEFYDNRLILSKISDSIYDVIKSDKTILSVDVDDSDIETQEGRLLTRTHRYRERDRKIIDKKKSQVLELTGHLKCEGCEFDFQQYYGEHGLGFIECHHVKPISEIRIGEKTKLEDLSLICSNCHRMIHRKKPWLTIIQLKDLVASNFNN
jgi:5-methylcytosine-specific restriction enzyme A